MDKYDIHINYLRKVLNGWSRFCSTYTKIRDSIQYLILENEMLREENNRLLSYLSEKENTL